LTWQQGSSGWIGEAEVGGALGGKVCRALTRHGHGKIYEKANEFAKIQPNPGQNISARGIEMALWMKM
jgi:hypothetical protein